MGIGKGVSQVEEDGPGERNHMVIVQDARPDLYKFQNGCSGASVR